MKRMKNFSSFIYAHSRLSVYVYRPGGYFLYFCVSSVTTLTAVSTFSVHSPAGMSGENMKKAKKLFMYSE